MQRLKRAVKRMSAFAMAGALLGATITSAVALDLAEFPAPFISATGQYDSSTAIVIGENALGADTIGATDIKTALLNAARVPVTSSGGTVSVSGGASEDLPIGAGIANDTSVGLDFELDDAD